MGLRRAGTAIALAVAITGVVVACAGDERVPPYSVCTVVDGDGRRYEAKDFNAVAALQTAIDQCTLNARDPTSCQEQGCRATW